MRFKRPRGESYISFSTALFSPEMSDSRVHPAPVDEGVPPPPPHPPPQLHVLAVDDSLLERMLIEKLLKGSAYRVTTVDSGKRALELLGFGKDVSCMKPKVNMIITDYCMPEMTGFDLLKAVKESSELREIPVVVVSSENVPTRISRCMEEGAEEFLLKPLRPSDVSRLHNHMLGMNRIGSVN